MKNYSINEIKDLYKKNFPKCKLVEKNNRKYLILKPLKIPFLKSEDCVIEVFYNSKYLRQGQLIESYRAFSKVKKFKGRKFKVLLDMYVDELQEDIKELDSLGVIVSDFKELEFLENRAGSKGLKGIEKEVYFITDSIQYNFIKSNYTSCIIESEKSVIYVLEELINKTYKEKDIVVLSNKNASLSEYKDRFESSDKRKIRVLTKYEMCSLSDDYIISNFDDSIVISIDTYATENEDELEDVYDIDSSYHEQTSRIIKFASRLKFIRLGVFPDF